MMTVNDLMKRLILLDKDTMVLYGIETGWSNISLELWPNGLVIVSDKERPFTDD